MDPNALLERTLDQAERVIANVKPDQLDNGTPCAEWKVRDVLNHIIGGNHFFAAAASGQPLPTGDGTDLVGDDPASAYAQGAKAALEAWQQPGVAERTITLPIGDLPGSFAQGIHFIDHLVHTWDLAKATGQDVGGLDAELAEAGYSMMKGNVPEQFRTGENAPFGPEVPCAEGAPAIDRLAAYLGRTP
jgi:uncharacterized protein (TIGR03086 family)